MWTNQHLKSDIYLEMFVDKIVIMHRCVTQELHLEGVEGTISQLNFATCFLFIQTLYPVWSLMGLFCSVSVLERQLYTGAGIMAELIIVFK